MKLKLTIPSDLSEISLYLYFINYNNRTDEKITNISINFSTKLFRR